MKQTNKENKTFVRDVNQTKKFFSIKWLKTKKKNEQKICIVYSNNSKQKPLAKKKKK